MESKTILKSKTAQFNALMGIIPVILNELGIQFGPDGQQIYLAIMAIGNIILRIITKQPITLTKPKSI